MYLKLDDGNGGILLNLGTGGLSLQAVARLNPEQDLILHFRLFDTGEKITVAGRVAWLGPTRKEAGICFKDLLDRTEQSIAWWIARQETGSHATEWKAASPVNAVPAASEIPLPLPQVSIASIPAGGTALDPQPSPSTALPSESHLGDTLPDPASSKPSTPLAFGASFPSPIPTNALHPKEHSAAPTVNQAEVPSEPLQPILQLELASPSGPSKEFLWVDRVPSDSPMPLSSTDAASGDKWIPPMPTLSSPQGKRRHQVLIVAGLAACFGILVLILMATSFGKHPENTGSSVASAPVMSVWPPAAIAPGASPAVGMALQSRGMQGHSQRQTMPLPATPSRSMSSPAPIPAPPQIVRRRTEAPWLAMLTRILLGVDDSPALDPAVVGISVWADKRSGFYYCADSPYFAKFQPGSLVTQGNALQSGYQPKLGSYCR
jgi:PilZ domain